MTERVLVAGGAGFLGSHLCERLLARGDRVTCVDNFSSGSTANVASLAGRDGFRLVDADVVTRDDFEESYSLVVNLASPASPAHYTRAPVATLLAGSSGTHNLLRLALRTGARFVMASTSEVYGDPLEHPQSEDYRGNVDPVGPRSCYDEAKRFAEALVVAFGREHRLSTGIARIFNTYGPRMRPDDGRVVPTLIGQALRSEPMTVTGDGTQTRSLCYVDDLVGGLVRLAGSDCRGPVNLGTTHEISMTALAEMIRDVAASGSAIEFVERPLDDPGRRRPRIDLADRELGWRPTVDLRTGLRRTVDWYRSASDRRSDRRAGGPTAPPAHS